MHVEWYTMGNSLEGIGTIKQSIMTHGVLGTCMCYANAYINWQYEHYQPPTSQDEPNHAVAIIGWDDNRTTDAPNPGAWLVKNSWGSAWGNSGYFWISYYDKHSARHPEMGAISFQEVVPMPYDHVYYHDYHGWRDTETSILDAFNAFVSNGNERVVAVNFFTAADSVAFTVTVYGTFSGGVLSDSLTSATGFFAHSGLHTVGLDDPVSLPAGDDFFVRLSLSHGGMAFDRTSEVPVLLGASGRTIVPSTASPGESYYAGSTGWMDFYSYNLGQYTSTANFCIKALTMDDLSTSQVEGIVPPSFSLLQPYPNPVENSLELKYRLDRPQQLRITLCDMHGREVQELLHAFQPAGLSSVNVNISKNGSLAPGLYIIRMDGERYSAIQKMMKK